MADVRVEASEARAPKGRGCLFSGCSLIIFILVLLAAVACVGVYYVVSEVNRYTSAVALDIPRHEPKPGEKAALEERIKEFERADPPARLQLSADDLNTLIVTALDRPPPAHARIKDKQIYVDASFELKKLPPVLSNLFEGRYFNGTLGLEPIIENGKLTAHVTSAVAGNGERVPDEYIAIMSQSGALDDVLEGLNLLPAASVAKKVEITDGGVIEIEK